MPAPVLFAIAAGSIVWSPHQSLRGGTAQQPAVAAKRFGALRQRDLLERRSRAPGGPLQGARRPHVQRSQRAPATLPNSGWNVVLGLNVRHSTQAQFSLAASTYSRIALLPNRVADVAASAMLVPSEVCTGRRVPHFRRATLRNGPAHAASEQAPRCEPTLGFSDTQRSEGRAPGERLVSAKCMAVMTSRRLTDRAWAKDKCL